SSAFLAMVMTAALSLKLLSPTLSMALRTWVRAKGLGDFSAEAKPDLARSVSPRLYKASETTVTTLAEGSSKAAFIRETAGAAFCPRSNKPVAPQYRMALSEDLK